MDADRPTPRASPGRRRLSLAAAVCAALLGACGQQSSDVAAPPPPQAMDPMPTASSPFRSAFDSLAALPPDGELAELRASAALSRLQGQVTDDDIALAEPLAGLANSDRAAIRATAVALLGQLATASGDGAPLPVAATEAVVRGMDDDDASVRLEATRAAAPLEGDAIHRALLGRLADSSPLVRFQALQALQARGSLATDAEARAEALKLREDPDRLVRELAQAVVSE